MSKAVKTEISLAHGDCCGISTQVQVKKSSLSTQNKEETKRVPFNNLTSQKADFRRKFPTDRYSTGDNSSIQPDRKKRSYESQCLCCQRQFKKAVAERRPIRVVYFDIPKLKFGGISVTANDYRPYRLPKREVPAWHPHRSQPWKGLDVPSVTETTYRKDFAPPILENRTRRLPYRPRVSNVQQYPFYVYS